MKQIYIFRNQCLKSDLELRAVNANEQENIFKPTEIFIKTEFDEFDINLDDKAKDHLDLEMTNEKVKRISRKSASTARNNLNEKTNAESRPKITKLEGKFDQIEGKPFFLIL